MPGKMPGKMPGRMPGNIVPKMLAKLRRSSRPSDSAFGASKRATRAADDVKKLLRGFVLEPKSKEKRSAAGVGQRATSKPENREEWGPPSF